MGKKLRNTANIEVTLPPPPPAEPPANAGKPGYERKDDIGQRGG
jgi:hypothetical protein